MRQPSILMLALPRTGSNWIAESLAISPTAAYLREPFTRSIRPTRANRTRSNFFEFPSSQPPPEYVKVAKYALLGIGNFSDRVARFEAQWGWFRRKHRRLFIKEVNPLALDWFVHQYSPRMIYLVRHPAGLASEIETSGWSGWSMMDRFLATTVKPFREDLRRFDKNFWMRQGALQALVNRRVQEGLAGYEDHRVVRYEDVCADPLQQFKALYEYCELEWTKPVEDTLTKRLIGPSSFDSGELDLRVESMAIANQWRDRIAPQDLADLREAYDFMGGPWFGDADW